MIKTINSKKVSIVTYNSINSVINTLNSADYEYINKETYMELSKNISRYSFTGVYDYNEAINLLKYGDDHLFKEIATKLPKGIQTNTKKYYKNTYDVFGFQASVPRYLQGIPTSMINRKQVEKKEKVIDIYVNITAAANVNKQSIIDNCVKQINVVRALENKRYRVNVYTCVFVKESSGRIYNATLIKIKDSSKEMNYKTMAFPMAHSAMLRVIWFALFENNSEMFYEMKKHYSKDVINRFINQKGVVLPFGDCKEILKALGKTGYVFPGMQKGIAIDYENLEQYRI